MNSFYSLLCYFANSQDNLHRFYRKYYPIRNSELTHTINVHWNQKQGDRKGIVNAHKCLQNLDSQVQGIWRVTEGETWPQPGSIKGLQRGTSSSHPQTGTLSRHSLTHSVLWGPQASFTVNFTGAIPRTAWPQAAGAFTLLFTWMLCLNKHMWEWMNEWDPAHTIN